MKVGNATIKLYLSAVQHNYFAHGYGDVLVDMARLRLTVKGIRRGHTHTQRNRIPLTADMLYRLVKVLQRRILARYEDAHLTAAVCVGFFGAMRWGEFTGEHSGVLLGDIVFMYDQQLDRKYVLLNLRGE